MHDAVLILGGPTCSGKTALALELAERFDAEIVGADSRQIYRGMPIGTAAPSAAELARVPHHLVAFLEPRERYSAARFTQDALDVIAALSARRKRAIVVGGTGFYIRALAGDVELSPAYDPAVRARLAREARLHPPDVMHEWLFARDPARAEKLAPTDRYRVARALEIALAEKPAHAASEHRTLKTLGLRTYKLALDVPQSVLDERIAARVDAMLAAGFVGEAEHIGRDAVASDAVGYPHALAYLSGASTFGGLRALLVRATRRYAKRQATWLRSEPQIRWIRPAEAAEAVRSQLGW